MNPNNVLLKTSSASDVQEVGNKISITGLQPIAKNSIVDAKQFKYHAEVVQVLTINTADTPVAGVRYVIRQENLNVRKGAYTQNEVTFAYTTTAADVAGTAAQAREIINLALIAQINAQTSNLYMTAATLTGGAGITVTDSAGYYPPKLNLVTGGRKGASDLVFHGGFTTASSIVTTTAAVYQFGDGTWLSQNAVLFSPFFQNIVSGSYTNPVAVDGSSPVAGQFYDAFAITSMVQQPSATGMMNQLVLTQQTQMVFVDNGTGAATTNAAGFLTFQRQMLKVIFGSFGRNNPKAMFSFFDNTPTYSTLTGLSVIPTTALAENAIDLGYGEVLAFTPSVIATSAAAAMPTIDSTNGGLNLATDGANGKGLELSAPLSAFSDKCYTVGKDEFSIYARIYVDDVSGVNPLIVGFRKKAAYAAAVALNDTYVGIGIVGTAATQKIYTQSIVAGVASTPVDSGKTWADAATHELEVRVGIDGVASYFVDGQLVAPPITVNTLTAGMVVIPFISEIQTADVAANISVRELASLPIKNWRA